MTVGSTLAMSAFPDDVAVDGDGRAGNDVVLTGELEAAGFRVEHQGEEVVEIARIERGGVGGDRGRQIFQPDELDAVLGDDLAALGAFDVAALLHREIDNDGTGLHRLYRVFSYQSRSGSTGN